MAVKISVLNIISKELDGNQQTVPFTPSGEFGKEDLDTVYYDPDTNRVTIHLSGVHTGLDFRDLDNFNYSLLPDTAEMESDVHYEGATVFSDKSISFTPLRGKNEYRFMNFAVIPFGENPTQYLTIEWAGVVFSFEGQ